MNATSPPPLSGPPRCAGSIARCRVGDWEYPAFVFPWWGRREVQRFQPGHPDPYHVEAFDSDKSVWLFERVPHPVAAMKLDRGIVPEVWKRIA